jgi:Tol biopolymer transport system component
VLVTSNVQRLGFDPVRGVVDGEPEWVTHGSRRWANPEPSPDGEFVAFYSLVEPEGDLYVMRADGSGAPRQVTADSASDRMPRWSPDGAWIAAFSDRSGPFEIWKIRPDGSGLTQLTKEQGISYTVWSPDGTRMLGRSIEGEHGFTLMLDPNRSWSEQHMDTLSVPPDSLAYFAPHSWSPNGSYVAGQFNAVDEGVLIYAFDTGRYERLTDYGQWPVWLPDSRRLLFVSGGKAFYVVDRETGRVREVFSVTRDVIGPPQLTHDGTMVYFTRRVTEADVYVARLQ